MRVCFNPRPRAAGDLAWTKPMLLTRSFNPRPRAAGDAGALTRAGLPNGFNPRPRAAGDIMADEITTVIQAFQSTPARGGRRLFPSG